MEVVGDGSASAGVGSKRMDDDLAREEQKHPEEKSPVSHPQLEEMHRGQASDFPEDVSNAIVALQDDGDATREDPQRNTSRYKIFSIWSATTQRVLECQLLHLSCKFDYISSLSSLLEGMPVDVLDDSGKTALHYAAEQHSVRCIDFLLKRRAKADIKSTEGLIALEIALQSERMQKISSSPADKLTDHEFLALIGDKDLAAIKMLADHTRDLAEVASRLIVHGNIVAFAALLLVAGDAIISTPVLSTEEHGDGTLFDVLIKKTISMGEQVDDHDTNIIEGHKPNSEYILRHILLKELSLFLSWYIDHDQSRDNSHRTPPTSSVPFPLLRAAQAGDVAIVGILIDHEADVNETDSGGNTALHWSLRSSANTRDTRVVFKLLRHGASITMGNRLGLTPVHIAAGQGHVQALQILLAVEPSSVDLTAETKETPLFSAVKGNHYECVRVLLQHGASRQVLNLRRHRPIDVAETSDMRALLYLQESPGRAKDFNSIRPPFLDGNFRGFDYDSEVLRFQSDTRQLLQYPDESPKPPMGEKTEICRYFTMPGGCVRGDKCFYAHREEELQGWQRISTIEESKRLVQFNSCATPTKMVKHVSEDLTKKIFVGGLSPSVESDDLREFFEGKFGAVFDAIVIGSHAGDHVQSRGFGFVTFKHEESVIAAVQAHYVNIFGKKVEIKGAVPRSVLPTVDCVKAGVDLSRPSSAESAKFSETDLKKVQDMPSLELLCNARGDLQAQLMNCIGQHGEKGEPAATPLLQGVLISAAPPTSPCSTLQSKPWVIKFKKWLPTFLIEVSNRLKEGEWYPLSSLKGDFRATCGLELDHVAIGYHKLSDFVRSIPEACRMKIVPVGRGPATHMVLLPALARLTPTITVQKPKSIGLTTCSALVDAGRSYAAAACELPGKTNLEFIVNTRYLMPPPIPGGMSSNEFGSHDVFSPNTLPARSIRSVYDEARLPDNTLTQRHTPLIDPREGHEGIPSHPQDQYNAMPANKIQEPDLTNLRDLLALMDNCEGQHGEDRVITTGAEYLTANTTVSAGLQVMAPPRSTLAISPDSHISSHQDDPQTPVHQVNLRPFSTFNHPFSGFLPQDRVNTYNMWGRHQGQQQSQITQTVAPKIMDNKLSWTDSPQSILYPYDRTYAQTGSQEAPRSLFSPTGSSPGDARPWAALCVYCCDRQSIWVAIPCNHHALCATCKDALHKLNRSTANCPVCASHVERWIALH